MKIVDQNVPINKEKKMLTPFSMQEISFRQVADLDFKLFREDF